MAKTAKFAVIMMFAMLAVALSALFPYQQSLAEDDGLKAGNAGDLAVHGVEGDKIFLEAQEASDEFVSPDGFVKVTGITAGKVTYDSESLKLTLRDVKANQITVFKDALLTIDLVGSNALNASNYLGHADVVVGGTGSLSGGIRTSGDLTIEGGAITAKEGISAQNVKITGGTLDSTGPDALNCRRSLTVTGGEVYAHDCIRGVTVGCVARCDHDTHPFIMSGGSIKVRNTEQYGIWVDTGDITMTGGTIDVINASTSGVSASTILIKGGEISATVADGGQGNAIFANSMSNKPEHLKTIKGYLPEGASFKVGKNTYTVGGKSTLNQRYAFIPVAPGKESSVPENVKYGGKSYIVRAYSTCASRLPVGADTSWAVFGEKYSFTGCKIMVLSGKDVVMTYGFDIRGVKAGTAVVALCTTYGHPIAIRTITVYNLTGRYLIQSCMKGKSNMCLDINGASKASGAQMIVWGKNGGNNQKFTFKYSDNRSYTYVIKSVNSGKVLDVNGASKTWGKNIIQWPANNKSNQKWRMSVDASNRITIRSYNSGLVLDAEGGVANWGARIIQWGVNDGLNQKWLLVPVK